MTVRRKKVYVRWDRMQLHACKSAMSRPQVSAQSEVALAYRKAKRRRPEVDTSLRHSQNYFIPLYMPSGLEIPGRRVQPADSFICLTRCLYLEVTYRLLPP